MVLTKSDTFEKSFFGKRHAIQYWQITTDTDTLPENSTWWVMTLIPGIKYKEVGNLYG
jgi:hypothetical protein